MPGKAKIIYWDSNVFIHYIEETAAYIHVLDELLRQAEKGDVEIVTSILSIAEVAFHTEERNKTRLNPLVETKIEALWADRSAVNLVEFNQLIAREARDLIRISVGNGWTGLKGADAVHLASARRLEVQEIHTCERHNKWSRYAPYLNCSITEPRIDQLLLPLP